ncbi:MAG: hypothetical protein Q9219_004638 [cf. Caloplaca sp. 3 TL-2023]
MSDPEGDSRMQSSSEASGEEDLEAMFPKADEPPNTLPTPQPTSLPNLQQFSELSPPSSNDPADSQTLHPEPMDQTNGVENSTSAPEGLGAASSADASQQQLSIAEREPGASWNTRKQMDEEDRTKALLLDKGFSLSTQTETP